MVLQKEGRFVHFEPSASGLTTLRPDYDGPCLPAADTAAHHAAAAESAYPTVEEPLSMAPAKHARCLCRVSAVAVAPVQDMLINTRCDARDVRGDSELGSRRNGK